ncbi:hypothetical protein FSP39_013567 [Pinctada imbricata]|uniref:Uncharacterized protein n=1 Tax=Pinctada imbricata TaxID=66713 RepID=A0AA89CAU8_PINIB|nr:hypothetical protein FSP39_013567 [Pinctada imbricata]
MYVDAQKDRVTVIFSTIFKDDDDVVIGKVFMQEFKEGRRKYQQAPQVLFSHKDPPQELQGTDARTGDNIGYITFVLFPRHTNKQARDNTINLIHTLRDYLHYHIKCSKAYIHSRMRAKTSDFLKVLNRARPEVKDKEKKTITYTAGTDSFEKSIKENKENKKDNSDNDGMNNAKQSLCIKLKSDIEYRRKYLLTISLFCSLFVMGWTSGQEGPALLDLQHITGVSLKQASGLFTSVAIGHLTGALVSGFIFDRTQNGVVITLVSVCGLGVSTALIPWMSMFGWMVFVHLMKGVFSGGISSSEWIIFCSLSIKIMFPIDVCTCLDDLLITPGLSLWVNFLFHKFINKDKSKDISIVVDGNVLLFRTWGADGKMFIQALHFGFALGGTISPFAIAPFLEQEEEKSSTQNVSTVFDKFFSKVMHNVSNTSMESHNRDDSSLYIGYSISAGVAFLASIVVMISTVQAHFAIKKHGTIKMVGVEKSEGAKNHRSRILSRKMKIIAVIVLLSIFLPYVAVESSFSSFLTTFCVRELKWTKVDAAHLTSTVWAALAVGRLMGIVITAVFSLVTILFSYTAFLLLSLVAIYLSALFRFDTGMWIFTPLLGISMSVIIPCVLAWTEESFLPVTGFISSLFIVGFTTMSSINPLILGVLMEDYTNMWFVYLLMGQSVLLYGILIIAYLFSKYISSPDNSCKDADEKGDKTQH